METVAKTVSKNSGRFQVEKQLEESEPLSEAPALPKSPVRRKISFSAFGGAGQTPAMGGGSGQPSFTIPGRDEP